MIYLVDIENIPNRYSAQWREWYINLFGKENVKIIGDSSVNVNTLDNEFMAFIPSNVYKANQISILACYLQVKAINEGDIVFFMDAWHPGVVALRQMMIHYPHKFQIYGYFHAGSYDENDILGPYFNRFQHFEKGLIDCLDKCLLATNYHLDLMRKWLSLPWKARDKFEVVGFLYNTDHIIRNPVKEKLIVFPHRIATEKHPELFDALAKELPEYTFIKTIETTKNKSEYYEMLGKARFSVSFADQETFGISMVESMMSGAIPIVPNKLSYQELYLDAFKYVPYGDIVANVVDFIRGFDVTTDNNINSLLDENIGMMLSKISGQKIKDVFLNKC